MRRSTVSEEDAQEIYDLLIGMVEEQGLSWIVAEVENEIQSGKSGTVVIKENTSSVEQPAYTVVDNPVAKSKTARNVLQTRVPFTARERVSILIDAVEQAVVNVGDLSDSVFPLLDDGDITISTVTFRPDTPNSLGFNVQRADATDADEQGTQANQRREARERLRVYLQRLKRVINGNQQRS